MAEQVVIPAPQRTQSPPANPVARFLLATELDTRLIGMIAALLVIWLGFHFLSGGI